MRLMAKKYAIAIHGGAGKIDPAKLPHPLAYYERVLTEIVNAGAEALAGGGGALDAVELAVRLLEDEPVFNAGRGSTLNADGRVEMDASIMDGPTGRSGAVAIVRGVRHPVSLARAVMEQTPHVLLAGQGAGRFADLIGMERVDDAALITELRHKQWLKVAAGETTSIDHDTKGTVGAVACDAQGRVAAATSTGGMINKLPGRVGDSPIVGAGTWADARCAVSGTGMGERIMEHATARRVADLVELAGLSLAEAARRAVDELPADTCGLVAVDARGHIALPHNTASMFRASIDGARERTVGIGGIK